MSANTLTPIAKRYLLYLQLERRLEVNTLNARWYDLEKYLSFLYKNNIKSFGDITSKNIDLFIKTMTRLNITLKKQPDIISRQKTKIII